MRPGKLLLLGDFDPAKLAHVGIDRSLALFNTETGGALAHRWVSSSEMTVAALPAFFVGVTGVWCTPGSPYASTAGALNTIRHARETGLPFLGTCGGFQHALMEFCSGVLAHSAFHAEQDQAAQAPLIVKLSCSLVGAQARVVSAPGSWYANTVGSAESVEEFNCNYGLAPTFEPLFAGSAVEFIARDDADQVRAFRLCDHPFFVGTLFQPERRALRGALHPLIRAFCKHAG